MSKVYTLPKKESGDGAVVFVYHSVSPPAVRWNAIQICGGRVPYLVDDICNVAPRALLISLYRECETPEGLTEKVRGLSDTVVEDCALRYGGPFAAEYHRRLGNIKDWRFRGVKDEGGKFNFEYAFTPNRSGKHLNREITDSSV